MLSTHMTRHNSMPAVEHFHAALLRAIADKDARDGEFRNSVDIDDLYLPKIDAAGNETQLRSNMFFEDNRSCESEQYYLDEDLDVM